MNPFMGGISQGFIEGAKDLVALVKYLGDKEMQEKQLNMQDKWHQQQYELQEKQIEGLQHYRDEMLKINRERLEAEKNINMLRQKVLNSQMEIQKIEKLLKQKELDNIDNVLENKKKLTELKLKKTNLEIEKLEAEKQATKAKLPSINLKNLTEQAETFRKWANFYKDSSDKTLQLIAKIVKPDKPLVDFKGNLDTKLLTQYMQDFLAKEDVDIKMKNKVKSLYNQYLRETELNQTFENLFEISAKRASSQIFDNQQGTGTTNNPLINRILQGEQ